MRPSKWNDEDAVESLFDEFRISYNVFEAGEDTDEHDHAPSQGGQKPTQAAVHFLDERPEQRCTADRQFNTQHAPHDIRGGGRAAKNWYFHQFENYCPHQAAPNGNTRR